MKTAAIVFAKELKDTLRDRRTIVFMFVIPLLLFPLLFSIMFKVEKSQSQKAENKRLSVALIDNGGATRLREILAAREDIDIVTAPEDSVQGWIRTERLDGAFVVNADFDGEIEESRPGRIDFYYRSVDDRRIIRERLEEATDKFEEEILKDRFAALGLSRDIVDGIDLHTHNVATITEQLGKQVGGFLPYMFILFCFMGSMYPAIDLGAGEKERGTIETLLTAPVSRLHILLGKFGVVVLSGITSALVSMLGLFIGFKQTGELPPEILDVIVKILGWQNIVLVLSLILPLTVFFAGILLSVSFTARSFREAQSLISPLNIAVIVPAAIGMVPGVTLGYGTAMIPILNVSLATREIIAGTITTPHLLVTYASLFLLAALSLRGAAIWFSREATIFRS